MDLVLLGSTRSITSGDCSCFLTFSDSHRVNCGVLGANSVTVVASSISRPNPDTTGIFINDWTIMSAYQTHPREDSVYNRTAVACWTAQAWLARPYCHNTKQSSGTLSFVFTRYSDRGLLCDAWCRGSAYPHVRTNLYHFECIGV